MTGDWDLYCAGLWGGVAAVDTCMTGAIIKGIGVQESVWMGDEKNVQLLWVKNIINVKGLLEKRKARENKETDQN